MKFTIQEQNTMTEPSLARFAVYTVDGAWVCTCAHREHAMQLINCIGEYVDVEVRQNGEDATL